MHSAKPVTVLLVEDSEDDRFFFKRLLTKAGLTVPMAVATDGQEAIDYLQNAIDHDGSAGSPKIPQLVFLDLKLPLRGGFEVLEWIRTQPALAHVIVVILSSSAETRDISQAYALGAQGYLVKYPEPRTFVEVMDRVEAAKPGQDLKSLKLPGMSRPPMA